MEKLKVYTVTLKEISDCKEPKKSQMYQYLKQINYTPIQITDSMRAITNLRGYKPVEIINPSALLESEV